MKAKRKILVCSNTLFVLATVVVLCFQSAFAGNGKAWVTKISESSDPRALKILVIDHSKFFYHYVPKIFCYMLKSRDRNRQIKMTEVSGSMFSLEDHWNDGAALNEMKAHGPWDYVVLYERTGRPGSTDDSLFEKYLGLFEEQIKKSHGKVVLVEAYNTEKDRADDADTHETMTKAATNHKALLVPLGTAWAYARKSNPRIDLYDPDQEHPGLKGSYLLACVLYCFFTGQSPSYLPTSLNYDDERDQTSAIFSAPEDARSLQNAAWAVIEPLYRARRAQTQTK